MGYDANPPTIAPAEWTGTAAGLFMLSSGLHRFPFLREGPHTRTRAASAPPSTANTHPIDCTSLQGESGNPITSCDHTSGSRDHKCAAGECVDASEGCPEGSAEEGELAAITHAIEAYEAVRWPLGSGPGPTILRALLEPFRMIAGRVNTCLDPALASLRESGHTAAAAWTETVASRLIRCSGSLS
jgi:hypothetical protein